MKYVDQKLGVLGVIEDITYMNFTLYDVGTVMCFSGYYRNYAVTNDTGTPKIKNIRVVNLYAEGRNGWDIDGLPESPFKDVYFQNVTLNVTHLEPKCIAVDGYCDKGSVTPFCPSCLNTGKCPFIFILNLSLSHKLDSIQNQQ